MPIPLVFLYHFFMPVHLELDLIIFRLAPGGARVTTMVVSHKKTATPALTTVPVPVQESSRRTAT